MSSTWYSVSETGEEEGPFDAVTLAARVRSGTATVETLVRPAEGAMKFRRLGTIRQLIDAIESAEATPPPAPEAAAAATSTSALPKAWHCAARRDRTIGLWRCVVASIAPSS